MEQNLVFGTVFAAGLLSFFNPCILPLMPVYFGILTDFTDDRGKPPASTRKNIWQTLLLTVVFLTGLSFTFIVLGFGAGTLSILLNQPVFRIVGGMLMILFGLTQMGLIPLSGILGNVNLNVADRVRAPYLRALLLGLTISLGWIPCIGPVLAAVLVLAAQAGTAFRGGFLMAVYTLGLAIPFLFIALFSSLILRRISALNRFTPLFKKIGGLLLVVMGVLMFLGKTAF